MNLRTFCLAWAFAALLPAQNAVLAAHLDRGEVSAPPPATLLVFEAKGSRILSEGFAVLLKSEALQAFEVPSRHLALGAGPDRALLARHHLAAKAQWVLVDRRRDAVVAGGEGVPDPDDFARSLLQAGFKDRVRELRAYLKVHPQSLEARELLLSLLRPRAERAAQRLMGVSIPSARERLRQADLARALPDAAAPDADLAGAKALDPSEDLAAWGAGQELDTVFKNGQWRELNGDWVREARPWTRRAPPSAWSTNAGSPRWKPPCARRRLPETLLGALALDEPGPGRGSPAPPAGLPPALPPHAARGLAAAAGGAGPLRVGAEPRRLASPEGALAGPLGAGAPPPPGRPRRRRAPAHRHRDIHHALLDGDWTSTLAPLLECCLRGGEAAHADALFLEALAASRWSELAPKASALARRCGQPALAARWSALRPPATSR